MHLPGLLHVYYPAKQYTYFNYIFILKRELDKEQTKEHNTDHICYGFLYIYQYN